MKRFSLLLLSLIQICIFTSSLAEKDEQFFSIFTPDGTAYVTLADGDQLEVPDGLQAMYDLMKTGNSNSDVYLFRAKNGRALISIASSAFDTGGDAQMLLSAWPLITESIAKTVLYINDSDSCASIKDRYGFETLSIDTDIAVGLEKMVLLDAQCNAFFRGTELIEVWTVSPAASQYLYDQDAAAELKSDIADTKTMLNSLEFGS